ncbi:MAG: HAD family hydrolase [Coriobacteriaceae bacterium]|nr:HAD family hydrolase [Coriobacteriaceae bacterium]
MAELKAVVFDMDDTLLSINLSAFLAVYALDEANLLAQVARKSPVAMFTALGTCMLELNNGEREEDDHRTNRAFFADTLRERTGIPLLDPVINDMLEFYEREVLPKKNDRIIAARPREGAHKAVQAVLDRGLRIALLTNPSFSRTCIECRMGWGDMLDMPFELVTTWENSTRCKPCAGYYLESLERLGLAPEETLMVGNDPKRDFPSPAIGLRTAYVGNGTQPGALWNGSMAKFAEQFDAIAEKFEA